MTRKKPPTVVNRSFKQPRGGVVTQAYIDDLIAKGAGSGSLDSYIPWFRIGSFSSRGASSWIPSVRMVRTHQTLSTGESNFLVLMEFNDRVLDIREQYPILDYSATHAIAISRNIKPAYYMGTSVPYVFTADLMLTMDDGASGTYQEGYSVKSKREFTKLSKHQLLREMQKFEIQKEYWQRQGIQFQTVWSEDLPTIRIKNLMLLRVWANLPDSVASPANIDRMIQIIGSINFSKVVDLPLAKLIREISRCTFIEYGIAKGLFFYLAWHRYIVIDLDQHVLTMQKPVVLKSISKDSLVRKLRGVA